MLSAILGEVLSCGYLRRVVVCERNLEWWRWGAQRSTWHPRLLLSLGQISKARRGEFLTSLHTQAEFQV